MIPDLTVRQKEALAMGKSLCVTAGAGTGKTFLLSKRYLALLMHLRKQKGTATVSEVLALTFTEKAASEMRERIASDIYALADAASGADEYRFWTGILDEFFRASITTFHGFCASVLREFALDAGLDPGFDILDEMEKQVLTTTLIRNVLIRPPESLYQDCALLFEDVSAPEKVIAELLPKYPEFRHHFPKTEEEMDACIREWRRLMLAAVRERQAAFFSGDIPDAVADLIDLAECYGDGTDSGAAYLRRILPALRQLTADADAETFCTAVAAVQEANGSKTGARLGSRGVFGTDLDRLRRSFAVLKSAVETVPKGWSQIPDPDDAFSRESVRVIAALGRVTDEVYRSYLQEKQQRGALDFEDLIRMTAEVIEIPGVLHALQRRFSYILVDEVQDTDPAQSAIVWKIIGTLTPSNDAVFIVGDPKQSIYAFRNADICEVNAMQERITAGCRTVPVALDISFRSTKEVLGVVNTIFSRLFSETAEAWDVGYDPISVSPERKTDTGTVQILKTIPDGSSPDTLLEARAIAARIRELIALGIMIRDGANMRPARFGDVAVLLETRNSQAMIEHALREADVPYSIYKSQGFYRSQEVADITQLLSVVAGLGDDIALYGVLRSPYFGIPDTELCIAGGGSYYGRVRRYAAEHPGSRIAAAAARLKEWQTAAGTEPLPELLRRILRESGMYAVYGGMQNGRYALANLEKLIGLARSQVRRRAMPLPEFVRMLATGAEQEIKESVAQIDLPEGDAVRIMTVHAAKGLEFPIVILANLDSTISPPGTGLVLDKDLGVGLPLRMHGARDRAADTFVKMFTREVRDAKEIAEKKRLFYVAMTRARDHLILSYVQGSNFPPKNSRAAWLAAYLLPQESSSSFTFATDDGIPVEISVTEYVSDGNAVSDTSVPAKIPSLPADYQYVRKETAKSRDTAGRPVSATRLNHPDRETTCTISASAVYGTALHGVFQGQDAAMLCRRYRLNAEARISLEHAYETFRISPLMQNVAEEFCELPFSAEICGRQCTGAIDRLVRYTDGTWRIIDYKSGSLHTAGADELEGYRRQVSIYAAAVRRLFSVEASACIYFAQDGGIMEVSLDESGLATLFDDRRAADESMNIRQSI
ncbi:MAG TPA: UvrD-helicase domain-containing protein [Methanocorpusculum sp.]|nr:UvrD-helicase domain-containing protein [Methanocorpusculum sp.]HJK81117.1 UvrD-helicase domain-containing protein [Methanocorpusculum sp.]